MEIKELIKNKPIIKTKIVNERQYVISLIVEEINKERPCTYKVNGKKRTLGLITPRAIAVKISHIPTNDLYYMLSQGKDYKNSQGSFNKYFWGSIKS
jgi:hypothetical protein